MRTVCAAVYRLYQSSLRFENANIATDEEFTCGYFNLMFDEGKTIPENAATITFEYATRQRTPKFYGRNGYGEQDFWAWRMYFPTLTGEELPLFYTDVPENEVFKGWRNQQLTGTDEGTEGLDFTVKHWGGTVPYFVAGVGTLDLSNMKPLNATGDFDRAAITALNMLVGKVANEHFLYVGNVVARDAEGNIVETLIDWSKATEEDLKTKVVSTNDTEVPDLTIMGSVILDGYTPDHDTVFPEDSGDTEDPGEPGNPEGPSTPDDENAGKGDGNPDTGVSVPAGLILLAGVSAAAAVVTRRKKR